MFIDYLNSDEDIIKILEEKKYVLVFLDHTLEEPTALSLLSDIRKIASRRKISVIIISRAMNKTELNKYKSNGTDYVLLSPFSSIKLLNRIFNSIILDRRT
jgi:DNA-binding response OmpR family regulator